MKNKINQLARGVFPEEMARIEIGERSIEEIVSADDIFNGELRIFSVNNVLVKGIVYAGNQYVTVVNSNFCGMDNLIAYRVDARGLEEGEAIVGQFDIVSDAGELTIPYTFTIGAKAVTTGIGKLKNMFHFTNYVQTDYEKALKLFQSSQFKKTFIGKDTEKANLYDALVKGSDVRVSVEEFLVAINKKAKVSLSVTGTKRVFEDVSENIEEKIIITKDNWGFIKAEISTDCDFLKLSANNIDSDSFAGNTYELSYIIDVNGLHGGRNFGKVTIKTDRQIIAYEVIVINGGFIDKESRHVVKRAMIKLAESYVAFRTKRINVSKWVSESQKQVEIIRGIDEANSFVKLFQAHLFIADKKETQAKWLIDNVKDDIIANKEKNIAEYCYYLYVNSLHTKDKKYAGQVTEEIRRYYEAGVNDWRLLWILLYLDDENDKNKSLKLIRIKEQFNKGCNSPIMYLEAAMILEEIPTLFRVLNEFEIQVIKFACKNKLISKKTADYVGQMIKGEKNIKLPLITILMNLYEEFESEDVLLILCESLIRNNCVGKNYFKWYELGVKKEFKITKLYEYYVSCIDNAVMEPLPKQILLYFMYNSDIDYKAKAYVYANVTVNKSDDGQMFKNYEKIISEFAIEQLKKGHINSNLSVIYRNMLTPQLINEGNKMHLPKILFTYKINCNIPNVANVIIKHKESSIENIYPVNKQTAYVQMYTKDALIILETVNKRRYIQSKLYTMERLLSEEEYIEHLRDMCSDNILIALYFAQVYISLHKVTQENIDVYLSILRDKTVDILFKENVADLLMEYYYEAFDVDDSFNIFVGLLGKVSLDKRSREKLLEIFILKGEYMRAYGFIKETGMYPSNPKRCYRLATKLIGTTEKQDDKVLHNLCELSFFGGKYDERIMKYLVANYNAGTADMFVLWEKAGDAMIDRQALSERIIAQTLFTGIYSQNTYEVFEDYYNQGGNERVIEAYVSYNCYNYFVNQVIINRNIMRVVEHRIMYGKHVLEVCKLALLHHYSLSDTLTTKHIQLAKELLEEFVQADMCFEFFKKFSQWFVLPYNVIDKTYVEYRTDKRAKVTIHYTFEEAENKNYLIEDMKQVYEGVFVKPFTLFYGKAVCYYITEELDDVQSVTESRRLVNESINPNQTDGRFEAINDILASYELKDMDTLKKLIHGYAVKDYITSEMFRPIPNR